VRAAAHTAAAAEDDADDQGLGTTMDGDGLADSGTQQQQRPLQTST
jgi:hypothetical protein